MLGVGLLGSFYYSKKTTTVGDSGAPTEDDTFEGASSGHARLEAANEDAPTTFDDFEGSSTGASISAQLQSNRF